VNVGGEDRDQQRNQSPGGEPLLSRDKKQNAQCDFKESTQINKKQMPRQIRRDDLHVEIRISKMVQACQHEEQGEEVFERAGLDGQDKK